MKKSLTRRCFLYLASCAAAACKAAGCLAVAEPNAQAASTPSSAHRLWFQQPAEQWVNALPLGNGRLGAMVFGGVQSERIALNEDTLWTGAPRAWNNPEAIHHLPIVRDLVLRQKAYVAADDELKKMQGPYNEAYQPLGDLLIEMEHEGAVVGYRRELDLDSAVSWVKYTCNDDHYTREVFVSAPAQAVVVRYTTTSPRGLHMRVGLASQLRSDTTAHGQTLQLTGKAPNYSAPNYLDSADPITYSEVAGQGMYFASVLRATAEGGSVVTEPQHLRIAGARIATLVLTMATGYRGYAVAPDTPLADVLANATSQLDRAIAIPYSRMLAAHIADHRAIYSRCALELTPAGDLADRPTDRRIANFAQDRDPSLLALYFNHGRYLLLTSSRPGSQPANLQGIWNADLRPPWSSNWTANINVQMNYWPVETCNLSECHLSLFGMVADLSRNGAETARVNYGARGWVSHHNIDLWRQSAPVGEGSGDPTWANFAMSGAWLSAHFFEHYRFTGDETFLRASYPVLLGAAEFLHDWLIERGDGRLTTCPSVSTENIFRTPSGKIANVSDGCTLDLALVREMFGNLAEAAQVLGADQAYANSLVASLDRLIPYQIGRHGQLQEWSTDFDEPEPGQRHMSQLYPVYPGAEITPRSHPELASAARVSLERRLANGGAYTGWSRAWAIGLWARLGDGEKAWESLVKLLEHSTGSNLFDTHPGTPHDIFQIDGNFGATAAMAELLLQSHDGEIALLPALPLAWRSGAVHGLRARGGMEVSMRWSDRKVEMVELLALRDGSHQLRPPPGYSFVRADSLEAGERLGTATLHARAGRRYRLTLSSAAPSSVAGASHA